MRTFKQAMASEKHTMTAAGDGQPWKAFYRGLCYVERAASWLKDQMLAPVDHLHPKERSMTTELYGFVTAADAIVPCKVCGAAVGEPCKDKNLPPGYVHFVRRVKRLLLTAGDVSQRTAFEARAVDEILKARKQNLS